LKLTLAYTYKVEGERYVGRESFTFIRDEMAADFEARYRGQTIPVYYHPNKPHISVLSRPRMG